MIMTMIKIFINVNVMYVFVICNCFIIIGPLLESTRIEAPDDNIWQNADLFLNEK